MPDRLRGQVTGWEQSEGDPCAGTSLKVNAHLWRARALAVSPGLEVWRRAWQVGQVEPALRL